MGLLASLRAYATVLRRPTYREVPDLAHVLARRPAIALGVSAYESALLLNGRVEGRLKALAAVKASSLIGCPF